VQDGKIFDFKEGLMQARAWPAQEKTSGPAVMLGAAQKAIAENDPAKAEEILAGMGKLPPEEPERRGLDAARAFALRGEIAFGRSRFLEGARHFAAAAAALPEGHEDERWDDLNAEAGGYSKLGTELGCKDALGRAIRRYRYLARLRPRSAFPRDWAMTQMRLGAVLQSLGEREGGTALLEESISAYGGALQVFARERLLLQCASAMGNQASALLLYAERRGDVETATFALVQIEAAVAVFR
jgi:tetratricopeptide (TPR) repeat protein